MSKSKNKKATVFMWAFVVIAVAFFSLIFLLDFFWEDGSSSSAFYDDGLVYDYMHVNIVFDENRTCHITNELQGRFLVDATYDSPNHGLYVDIPVNSGERVKNLTVDATLKDNTGREEKGYEHKFSLESMSKIVRVRVGDPDRSLNRNSALAVTVEYDYELPKHKSGNDVLAIMAIGNGWTSNITDAVVSVTYPAAPEITDDGHYGIYVAGEYIDQNGDYVVWSNDGKTVTVNVGRLRAFYGVELAYKMPDGTVKSPPIDWVTVAIISASAALLLAAALLKIFVMKNKPLTPIVDYYPPRIVVDGRYMRMLPVQLGKIIDDKCSDEDVTSLIFYWASKGFLEIDERDNDVYLIKLCDIDPVTGYEHRMFDRLFRDVEPNEDGRIEVSIGSLSGRFYNTINRTRTSVETEYKGKFYTSTSKTSGLVALLVAIFGVAVGLLLPFKIAFGLFNLGGLVMLVPVIIGFALGTAISKLYFKLTDRRRILYLIGFGLLMLAVTFAASLFIPVCVFGWTGRVLLSVFVAALCCLCPFMVKRTDYYNEMLNSILGFRNFLRDARRDELETLLKDDPQYYYDILPYANVLGVSEIWSNKFKDLTIEPPTHIRSYRRVTFFDFYVMDRMMHSVHSGLNYVPPKANSGSFSRGSGGGGSFGGGGFSGGSFGGGGGGRW